MPSFNLVTEKWIPCVTAEGTAEEFSLSEVLTQAHRIKELSDDSPLVTVALHRLLLALLHRNFGPASFDKWKELWGKGAWDETKLKAYFAQWQHRFELFDSERPFYQEPFNDSLKTVKPLSQLAEEMATGNNATLFSHNFEGSGKGYSPAQAARFLMARQAYGFAGTGGYFNSTMIAGYSVFVLGGNLFETLALNLIKYDEELPIPQLKENGSSKDLPFWEQDESALTTQKERHTFGYLDYLTWQSRHVHIINKSGDISFNPSHCQYAQKLKLKDENLFDPFKAYYKGKEKGFVARRLVDTKALWRDGHSLLEASADLSKIRRPEVFNHLAQIEQARRQQEIQASPAYRFAVSGMVNEQASVSMWSREILPLPLSYLIEKQLTSALNKAIQLTEAVETPLKEAIKKLSVELVGKVDAPKFSDSFQAKELYWSSLNAPFKKLMTDLVADEVYDENDEVTRYGETELPKWAKFVARQADNALQHAINSLRGTARELKAASFAEAEFNKQMSKLSPLKWR